MVKSSRYGRAFKKVVLNIIMFNIILIFLLKMLVILAFVLLVYHLIKFHISAEFFNVLISVLGRNIMNLLSAWYRI